MLTRAKAYRTTTAALSNRQLKKIKEIYAFFFGFLTVKCNCTKLLDCLDLRPDGIWKSNPASV